MKKKSGKSIKLKKTMISNLASANKLGELLGGRLGTSPKCAYSEWESCEGPCEQNR